jgi:hypothetical protein
MISGGSRANMGCIMLDRGASGSMLAPSGQFYLFRCSDWSYASQLL